MTQLKQLNIRAEDILTGISHLKLHLLPHEKVIRKPKGMPSLPVSSLENFNIFEKYLEQSEDNMSMTVSSSVDV